MIKVYFFILTKRIKDGASMVAMADMVAQKFIPLDLALVGKSSKFCTQFTNQPTLLAVLAQIAHAVTVVP